MMLSTLPCKSSVRIEIANPGLDEWPSSSGSTFCQLQPWLLHAFGPDYCRLLELHAKAAEDRHYVVVCVNRSSRSFFPRFNTSSLTTLAIIVAHASVGKQASFMGMAGVLLIPHNEACFHGHGYLMCFESASYSTPRL